MISASCLRPNFQVLKQCLKDLAGTITGEEKQQLAKLWSEFEKKVPKALKEVVQFSVHLCRKYKTGDIERRINDFVRPLLAPRPQQHPAASGAPPGAARIPSSGAPAPESPQLAERRRVVDGTSSSSSPASTADNAQGPLHGGLGMFSLESRNALQQCRNHCQRLVDEMRRGATSVPLADLPFENITELECVVCMELFSDERKPQGLSCRHCVCELCVAEWAVGHSHCPKCRSPFQVHASFVVDGPLLELAQIYARLQEAVDELRQGKRIWSQDVDKVFADALQSFEDKARSQGECGRICNASQASAVDSGDRDGDSLSQCKRARTHLEGRLRDAVRASGVESGSSQEQLAQEPQTACESGGEEEEGREEEGESGRAVKRKRSEEKQPALRLSAACAPPVQARADQEQGGGVAKTARGAGAGAGAGAAGGAAGAAAGGGVVEAAAQSCSLGLGGEDVGSEGERVAFERVMGRLEEQKELVRRERAVGARVRAAVRAVRRVSPKVYTPAKQAQVEAIAAREEGRGGGRAEQDEEAVGRMVEEARDKGAALLQEETDFALYLPGPSRRLLLCLLACEESGAQAVEGVTRALVGAGFTQRSHLIHHRITAIFAEAGGSGLSVEEWEAWAEELQRTEARLTRVEQLLATSESESASPRTGEPRAPRATCSGIPAVQHSEAT